MAPSDSANFTPIEQLQQVWETLAQTDPLWAILTAPDKRGRKWDLDEFFATGEGEIKELEQTLSAHEIAFDRKAALDFGCGVGRLTQAIARRFESACGIDISPTMIDLANKLNRYPEKCRYLLNAGADLQTVPARSFTFIYSSKVLQHIEPRISRVYLSEFARIAQPGALVVFQLPSHRVKENGLPPTAFAASLACSNNNFESWTAGARQTLNVSVQNISPVAWLQDGRLAIQLGNHWLSAESKMIRIDDGRVMLPKAVQPGEQVNLSLEVSTPPSAGRYILELDLVQQGVAWFEKRGSKTLRIPVEVQSPEDLPSADASESGSDPEVAKETKAPESLAKFQGFGMHCFPRIEVLELFNACGLRLQFIEESNCAGAGFRSYLYFARKMA